MSRETSIKLLGFGPHGLSLDFLFGTEASKMESVNKEEQKVSKDQEHQHHITLFPTRLREFDEKEDLAFHHCLAAINDLRHKEDESLANARDPIRRRSFNEVSQV